MNHGSTSQRCRLVWHRHDASDPNRWRVETRKQKLIAGWNWCVCLARFSVFPFLMISNGPTWEMDTSSSLARRSVPNIPRKEVIQPHLPVRLPCYDFTPITDPTLDACLPPKRVSPAASGVADFRGVTGGVYKTRERIHRGVLTHGY